jgi:hypothetical protein
MPEKRHKRSGGTAPLVAGTAKGHRRCVRRCRQEAGIPAGSSWDAERVGVVQPMAGYCVGYITSSLSTETINNMLGELCEGTR